MDHRQTSAPGTAYHSFNDVELYEPPSPPKRKPSPSTRHSANSSSSSISSRRKTTSSPSTITTANSTTRTDESFAAPPMKRQDSGYESHLSTPRGSISHPNVARPAAPRRTSTSNVQGHFSSASVPSTATKGIRSRPSSRRFKSHCHSRGQSQPQMQQQKPSSVYLVRSVPAQQTASSSSTLEMSSYVHFPSPPEPVEVFACGLPPDAEQHPPPPQTTHYWTSDRTRRLEYAAIDAASRGVKGWIKRNLVPDCFGPKGHKEHIPFDDDTGSVRRYRLELEDDVSSPCAVAAEKACRRAKTWQFWSSGRSSDDERY